MCNGLSLYGFVAGGSAVQSDVRRIMWDGSQRASQPAIVFGEAHGLSATLLLLGHSVSSGRTHLFVIKPSIGGLFSFCGVRQTWRAALSPKRINGALFPMSYCNCNCDCSCSNGSKQLLLLPPSVLLLPLLSSLPPPSPLRCEATERIAVFIPPQYN